MKAIALGLLITATAFASGTVNLSGKDFIVDGDESIETLREVEKLCQGNLSKEQAAAVKVGVLGSYHICVLDALDQMELTIPKNKKCDITSDAGKIYFLIDGKKVGPVLNPDPQYQSPVEHFNYTLGVYKNFINHPNSGNHQDVKFQVCDSKSMAEKKCHVRGNKFYYGDHELVTDPHVSNLTQELGKWVEQGLCKKGDVSGLVTDGPAQKDQKEVPNSTDANQQ